MEYKQNSINIDTSFIRQEAVREFLQLPSTEDLLKIKLIDFIEIAKAVITDQLIASGYSEQELTGFRLEYHVSKTENQEDVEVYSCEWNKLPHTEKSSNNQLMLLEEQPEINPDDYAPLSLEFLEKFSDRIDEAVIQLNPLAISEQLLIETSATINFKSFTSQRTRCLCDYDPQCFKKDVQYKTKRINGAKQGCCWESKPVCKPK